MYNPMLWSRWTWCIRIRKTWSWNCHQTIRRWLCGMQLLEGFNRGLLLMLTHQLQLQRRPLLVSWIPLLLRYLMRHVYLRLQIQSSYLCLQFKRSCVGLQFWSSHGSLQFESSRKSLQLKSSHTGSSPRTRSNPFPTTDLTQAKTMKNVRGKSHLQQRRISSKTTKGKQQLK
jgi:hypothetical protein